MQVTIRHVASVLLATLLTCSTTLAADGSLRVGTAAVNLVADDSMVIAGSILPGSRSGQEGELRAVAIVVQGPKGNKAALVACDVLMMRRDILDPAAAKIEQLCNIPSSHVLIQDIQITLRNHKDTPITAVVEDLLDEVGPANWRITANSDQFLKEDFQLVGYGPDQI